MFVSEEGKFLKMPVIRDIRELNRQYEKPVVTIGNFDGVHMGHRVLFDMVKERAAAIGGTSMVVTFEPHPHTSPGSGQRAAAHHPVRTAHGTDPARRHRSGGLPGFHSGTGGHRTRGLCAEHPAGPHRHERNRGRVRLYLWPQGSRQPRPFDQDGPGAGFCGARCFGQAGPGRRNSIQHAHPGSNRQRPGG